MADQILVIQTPPQTTPQYADSIHADQVIVTFHNILVSIKLDNSNYIIWKHQI